MKKILFLLLILFSLFSFGQNYKVSLKNFYADLYYDSKGDKGCDTNEYWIDIYTVNGNSYRIKESYEFHGFTDRNPAEVIVSGKVSRIYCHSFHHANTGIGCNGGTAGMDENINIGVTCFSSKFYKQVDGSRNGKYVRFTLGFDAEVTPIININPVDPNFSNIGFQDNLTVSVTNGSKGFSSSDYQWEYQMIDFKNGETLSDTSWTSMPSNANLADSFTIKPSDFLPNNSIGKRIYFRIKTCNNTTDPIWYDILQSAPHILSSSITPNLCSYGETGTATLNFDRTLLAGETLKISLVNTVTGAATQLPNDGYITNELQTKTTYVLQNLPPGIYKLDLLGTLNNGNEPTYTDSTTHTVNFEITKPTPVTFDSPSKTDVFCFQGNDGIINLTANGGQNQYQYLVTKDGQSFLDWTNFDNGNNASLQNLSAGVYKIKVRDSNQCIAKDPNNTSVEKEITVTITQPSAAIALPNSDIEIVQPTGYGLSNGYISVRVTGGTPNSDGSYNFEWRKDSPTGAVLTDFTPDVTNNPFTIRLNSLPAGKYYLTVKDKNYANATSQLGNCGIISQEFIVEQPLPLVATIEIEKQISCNIANDYAYIIDLDNNGVPDEAEDGNLKVLVTGGVVAYSYQWQVLKGGTFQDIPGATQPVLSKQSVGTYKILVHDASLIPNTTDASYTFVYPPQLAITMSANTISCYNQNSGMVSVNATGGTGSLSYEWNTSDTTPTVTGLPGGNYFVLVTDSKNCKVKGNVQVVQPDQIIITDVSVQNPICFGASNGEIKTTISGGKAPYSISWSNGKTGTDNLGIPAGTYTMTVTDANGCSSTKQYILVDPAQRTVDLGADVTLCLGDTQTYNLKIDDAGATYEWKDQNGNIISTSSTVTLSAAGTYSVLITDSKGCTATDSIKIKNSSEVLNPQFMLTTHAYSEATVVLVNTSPTKPQVVEWVIPANNNIQVISKTDDYLELKFLTTGSYEIGLKGIQGECVKTFYKNVVVEENISGVDLNPTKATNITEFTILPNPNNGAFQILVGLGKEKPIKIRILDMVSHEVFPAVSQPKATYFVVPFSTTIPAGTYLVILETGDEAMVKRMIVK